MNSIPNAFQSIAAKVAAGQTTWRQAAAELHACNLLPFIDEDRARSILTSDVIQYSEYKPGSTYRAFGCTWIIDDVYKASDERLYYKWRYRAHVVEAFPGYTGATEVDAAVAKEWAR